MRDVTQSLYNFLNGDDFDPVEILQVKLVGQAEADALRFTNAGHLVSVKDVVQGVVVQYQPFPMSRGEITERLASTSGEVPAVTMTITNVNSQMAVLLGTAEIERAQATLWLTDRRLLDTLTSRPRNMVQVAYGEIRNSVLADSMLTFQIISMIGQSDRITLPRRVYQSHCNYVFGSAACGFDWKAGVDVNGVAARVAVVPAAVALAGSTSSYIVVGSSLLSDFGSPVDPTALLAGGYLQFTDGVIGLQSRSIQRVDTVGGQVRIYLREPFLAAPNANDPIIVQRICQRTKTACTLFQGNALNYGGFEEAPPVRFKPTEHTPPKGSFF